MSLCPEREDFSVYEESIRGNIRNVGTTGEIFRCNKRHECAYGLCTCMKSFFINFAELVAFDLGTGVLPERLPVVSGKKSCGVKKRISSHFTDYSWKNGETDENWEDWSRSLTIDGNSVNLENGQNFGEYESSGDGTDIILKGVTSHEQLGSKNQDSNSTKISKIVFRAEKTVKFEIDACCGNLPDWKPYSTMGGERGCCSVKVFDKQFDTCCGGRVTEIGSCGLDDYKSGIQGRSEVMQYDVLGFDDEEEEEDYDEVDAENDENYENDDNDENLQNVDINMHLDDDFDFSDISDKHSFVAPECITNPSSTVTADQISRFCSEHKGYELALWPERSCSKFVDCTKSILKSCPTGEKFNGTSCTSAMTDYDCGIHFKYNEIPLAFEISQDSQTKYIVLDEHHSAKYFCDKIKPGYFSSFVWLDWTCQKYVECYGDDHSAILSCDEGEIYNGVVRACVKSTSRRGQQCGEMFVEEHHFGQYQPVWQKGCL